MKLKPIITSLLETDQYKFNMGNIIFKKFNDYTTTWTFKCRNKDVKFTNEMVKEIREQFDYYCNLKFTEEELDWLKTNLPWLSTGYINYLKFWHPVRNEVIIQGDTCGNTELDKIINGGVKLVPYNDCGLAIEAKGTWLNTSMYEIALLAIVNEVYFAFKYNYEELETEFKKRTDEKIVGIKIGQYNIGTFSEFGMRRRLSKDSQDWLIWRLKELKGYGFIGTSNVYLAKKYGIRACGTMAHEFIQCLGQSNPKHDKAYSNYYVMKEWVNEYQTRNGIMLGDTITTECFLKDFDLTYANLFSGVRHDSDDPIEWGEKILTHYNKLGIDPKTKTLLFSDSLNFEKATNILKYFKDKCKVAFGIGTYLANDTNVEPLNIVMKVTECNGMPVAKLSDVEGKCMCRDDEYIDYLKRCINWRLMHEKE